MKRINLLLLVACMGMTAAASAQGVYKYVVDGKVVYSDQPPPGSAATKIDSYSSDEPVTRPTSDEEPVDTSMTALRSKECAKAKERLKQYQDSPTLVQRNLKGEQVNLSADERLAIIMRAQQDMNDLCNPAEAEQEDDGLTDLTADVETLN